MTTKTKQPETQERFRVHCEVDTAEEMGVVIAQLTRMGLKNLGHEMITDVLNYKGNRAHATSAIEAITEWVKENPTFAIGDVVKHFKADGRRPSAIYTAVAKMTETGLLKKLGKGNYSVAAVKHIEGPKSTMHRYETTNQDLLLKTFRNKQTFSLHDAHELFRANGRDVNSVSPLCNTLFKKKLIKRVGPLRSGRYSVTKKKTKTVKKASAKHLNGKAARPMIGVDIAGNDHGNS